VMLRSGTVNRTSRDIAEQLDLLGAGMSTGTTGDPGTIMFGSTGLSGTFTDWFPLISEILMKPSFPADELTLGRRSFASEIAARRATSTAAASDLIVSVLTGSSVPIVATSQMISQLTVDRIAAWHRERYVPQNTVLSIVGDVDAEKVERIVRATFSSWGRTGFTETPPAIRVPPQRAVHILDRPGSVQTTLMLGGAGVNRADADYPGHAGARRNAGGASVPRAA
jgi:zinc protease